MNLPKNQEISLYQIAENFEPKPPQLLMSLEKLDQLVISVFDVLRESNLSANIWTKYPDDQRMLSHLRKYQINHLYWCSTNLPLTLSLINATHLEIDSRLKCEFFFVFITTNFWGIILVKSTDQDNFEVIFSGESNLIRIILQKIIKFSDHSCQNICFNLDDLELDQSLFNNNLLSSLLLKQVNFTPVTNHLEINHRFLKKVIEEFRFSLTRIKTGISLLTTRKLKPELQKYLDVLSQECQHQNYLIKGLLELSDLEELSLDISNQHSNLAEIITEIFSNYQPLAKEKNITLKAHIPEGLPGVKCPKTWLKQILIHLVNNSLKFTQIRGNISLEVIPKSHCIILIFRDDGMGIPRSEIGKIFDSFYRGKLPISQGIPGAGLGLTIVQQLLTRCGGSIAVVSKVNQGTIFRVKLPIYEVI